MKINLKNFIKNILLFYLLKFIVLYFVFNKVYFFGFDKKWFSFSCSSSLLVCGGCMFFMWLMEWDII